MRKWKEKAPPQAEFKRILPGLSLKFLGHHLIHDTIVSQETQGSLNAGYAALFEIALYPKRPSTGVSAGNWKLPVSFHAGFRVCR